MVEPMPRDDVATYEIRFRGEIPPSMRARLSRVTIHHSSTETVLHREVTDVAELDLLLDQLQSMGVVLSELQESPAHLSGASLGRREGGNDE
jgi:hypothetical protein